MKVATISNKGIELKKSVELLNLVNTPDEIIGLHEFCTGQHVEDAEEILDSYETITPAMENLLSVVFLVRGVDKFKAVITFEKTTGKILIYAENEDGEYGKMELRGVYQVFNDEDEAIKYADYQYAITRRDELVRQITELNEELSSVMVEVTKGVKLFG